MSRKSKIAGATALGLMGLLILSEITLRLVFGLGRPLLYAADPNVGYLPAASQELRRFGTSIRINAYGMRSESFSEPRRASSVRLLFIGDSVTFGTTHVDQSDIFTELIKASLNSSAHTVEVLNASAGGWGTDNEYRYLVSRGTFGADWVIFVVNSGDLDQPFNAFAVSPQYPTANPPTAIGELWTRYLEPRMVGLQTHDAGSILRKDPDLLTAQHVLQTLESAQQFATRRGARFVVIFSPTDLTGLNLCAWSKVIRNFHDWIERNDVAFIDMTPVYARYPPGRFQLDGVHLSAFGHELVAQEFLAHYARVMQRENPGG